MRTIFLSLLLALSALPALAEVEVIQLNYRSTEEILPLIRPLLDSDGVANGMGSQLILRTSASNLAEIKSLLSTLDRAPRRLQITVLQNVDGETMRRLAEVSGSVGIGAGRARIGAPGGAEGKVLTIAAGQGNDQLRARISSTRALEGDNKTQQIQVLEGSQALISVGQSVAVPQRQIVQSPWHTQVTQSTQYRDVDSGFYVRPRLNGDRVTLEISTQNDAVEGSRYGGAPAVRTQKVLATVSGRLGEWMVLGGTLQQGDEDTTTIGSHTMTSKQETRRVLLKVDEIN